MTEFGGSRFRESAIVRNAHLEPLDDRAQLTAPREWAVLACLGLALAAVVIWGVFGTVERTLRSDGVLVLSGDRRAILSPLPGTVAEVSAREGDRVAAGQPILQIAPLVRERPVGLSAAIIRELDDAAANETGAARAEAQRLLASARAPARRACVTPEALRALKFGRRGDRGHSRRSRRERGARPPGRRACVRKRRPAGRGRLRAARRFVAALQRHGGAREHRDAAGAPILYCGVDLDRAARG